MDENKPKEPSIFDSLNHTQQRSTIVGMLILVALIVAGLNALASGKADLSSLADNLAIELFGAALTFYIFDRLIERRDDSQRKTELILQMGSPDNGFAVEAVRLLRQKGWLTDGSLQKTNLQRANLQGANLGNANLQGVDLGDANLQGAYLSRANLRGAYLMTANLQGANFQSANLQGAYLREAKFNEHTTLPHMRKWTPETDMTRFTNPEHPNFWRPNPYKPEFSPSWYKPDSD